MHGRPRGVPDGTPGRVRLGVLLHDDAGPSLGPRHLMATPPGARPPEGAKDNPREQVPTANAARYAARIEDYALIGDCHSAALVSREGSIDWLCWPRFDSAACFAALVGTPDNGRWRIAPAEAPVTYPPAVPPRHPDPRDDLRDAGWQRGVDRFHDRRHRQLVGGAHRRGTQRPGRDAARSRIAVRLRLGHPLGDAVAAWHWPARHRRAGCRGAA